MPVTISFKPSLLVEQLKSIQLKHSLIPTAVLAFFVLFIACKEKKTPEISENQSNLVFLLGKPSEVGIDGHQLEKMEEAIQSNTYPNIHSVLIHKNGKLIYEQYFEGQDEIWGDSLGLVHHSMDKLHDVRSISKSIVSACVGLAVEQGKIKSVDQSVFEFFPEYAQYNEGLRSQLTLKHLLTMTSGIEWNEDVPYTDPENSEILMTASPDPMEYVLSRPMESEPGKYWEYNGGTTQLLAAIIKKTTGQEIDDFAHEFLFQPLGIDQYEWTQFPGLDLPAAASGLRLTSRDLLKFGLLYANKGKWKDKQVLSEQWITDSMQSYVQFGRNNNVGYGYQFWIFKGITITEKLDSPIVTAVGNGDQRIYIDKANDMIVVTTAGNYNNWTIEKNSEALLTDFIYPAIE